MTTEKARGLCGYMYFDENEMIFVLKMLLTTDTNYLHKIYERIAKQTKYNKNGAGNMGEKNAKQIP